MPSKIEWLQGGETWNPITGCSPISIGCMQCYAKRLAEGRLKGRYGYPKKNPFAVTYHKDKLTQPLGWRKPRNIFICSMGDLFHPQVDIFHLNEIFAVMKAIKRHRYLILTKRPERMLDLLPRLIGKSSTPHIFFGISAENQETLDERMKFLLKVNGRIFVSLEPLLAPVHLSREHLIHLDWVIAGSESGTNARWYDWEWFCALKKQCVDVGVPYFLKQIVVNGKKISMPKLDGKVWNQMPKH